MPQISATLTIEQQPRPDLLLALLEMEVDLHHKLASTFRLKVAMLREAQGLWRFLDDEALRPWARIGISLTVADEERPLLDGYVTEARSHVSPDESGSHLELVGMDASVLMALEEKTRDWANKKDSDIAETILREHGFTPHVEDTEVVHDEAVSTILQRETDIRFLKRLADRNGFECVIRGTDAYFEPPSLDEEPLPTLATHFGGETNLTSFDARWDAVRSTGVQMSRIDALSKELETAAITTSALELLGRDAAPAAPGTPSLAFVKQAVSTNLADLQRLCQAQFDEASWFVSARGEVDTAAYGAVLEARRVVPIKGVGGPFSGVYYLTSVRHRFTPERHEQHFTARRNALFARPDDFQAGGGLPI
ncbi:MAG TPA: contractile injection system protein, VgrG/Pvc8 family [Polyangiaceae bacterium]|nr:contractile injection system protein, VgrG/Pvc8 family [Polyangiaceae bacterium]